MIDLHQIVNGTQNKLDTWGFLKDWNKLTLEDK